MKILVINAGSSSLKYQLIDMTNEQWVAKGNCERIGLDSSIVGHKTAAGFEVKDDTVSFPTHKEAFMAVIKLLTEGSGKVIDSMAEISAIGHRAVHGGEEFTESTFLTDAVIDRVDELKELSPLHNGAQAIAMRACREVFGPDVPMAAVFDTSFHQTMPREAYTFGIPYEYYEKYRIRRYGFHGTSHKYLTNRYAEITGKRVEDVKLITCHLGNGSSISAVVGGKVLDTSMGFTPLDGFIMGTRSGGVDPSALTYLMQKENLTPAELSDLLNKKSGILGLSGVSSDMRDVRAESQKGNDRCTLTLDMLGYQIKKFVGGYAAVMNGADAIIFTGGIGENDSLLREYVCSNMEYMGVKLDGEKNSNTRSEEVNLSLPGATTEVWVIPTNEELVIARDTMQIVKNLK